MNRNVLRNFVLPLVLTLASASLAAQATVPATPAAAGALKQIGSIRNITGAVLTLATDQGTAVTVRVQPGARVLRLAPGQTDLKGASQIQFADLQVGDRVLVRGKADAGGVSLDATAVIVMKRQDIAQMRQQEMLDWQRRGVGGLVKRVDLASGSITLAVGGAGGSKTVVVGTTPKTTFKRYAPESVQWEDATAATLADIHPGDQLRAKGDKNEDGSQIAAEEIVSGTFRNLSGLVTATDPAQGTLTVGDLATRKPVTVRITAGSQMKELPPRFAEGLAMRLRGGTPPLATPQRTDAAGRPRSPDLNQLLARLPALTLGEVRKGEAVMIVSTVGSPLQPPVAITLLGGVEPILTASPEGAGTESFLTPWSLASVPSGDQQ